jgi:RNA polymerase sigma-70 factor (ECF subfamily)
MSARLVPPADLDLVAAGDEAAVRRIVDDYSPLVYGVVLRITRCEADAADVTQEVFIALPELLRSFDGDAFAEWLTVVSIRMALMHVRAETRRRQRRQYAFTQGDAPSHEERTLSGITVERALARLDPLLRTVFVLWELEGFSHREIAEAMNITENLSQMRLYRARLYLRRMMT